MGSGHFADEGHRKASYFRNIMTVDKTNTLREPQGVYPTITNDNCYNIKEGRNGTSWGFNFFYGGPGLNAKCPWFFFFWVKYLFVFEYERASMNKTTSLTFILSVSFNNICKSFFGCPKTNFFFLISHVCSLNKTIIIIICYLSNIYIYIYVW